MLDTAQITGFGQHRHSIDRPDPGDGRWQLIVGKIGLKLDGSCFKLIALLDEAAPFG